jgi:hypothetical protein
MSCTLVVLCSTPEQAARATAECVPAADDLFVTYVTRSAGDELLPFLTSSHPETEVEPSCHADIARKRNIGLLLGRLCGWRTAMFLDDDIRSLTAGAVSRAAALTARFQAAGFEISHYPDNSVVCHAHRLTGGRQGTFPGGSALLIDLAGCDTLFPPIYNEDWLFLFDALQRRSVTVAGQLSQLEYQPFARSARAASEEFGDVIAEGLYQLLHEGGNVTDASSPYWGDVLARRGQFIEHVASCLLRQRTAAATQPAPAATQPAAPATQPTTPAAQRAATATAQVAGYALMSLAAARKRLTTVSPLACASFAHAWQTDLEIWRERLLGLPLVGDIADAAKFLNLPAPESCVTR